MPSDRTALLIRCSKEEAEKIRAAAKRERRTLSGYVLHVILNRITIQEKLGATLPHAGSCAISRSTAYNISTTFSATVRAGVTPRKQAPSKVQQLVAAI